MQLIFGYIGYVTIANERQVQALLFVTSIFKYLLLQFTALVFVFFGYMMDVLFCAENAFVFDPNIENWKRKTDPQS